MELTDEYREWVKSLKVGDNVQAARMFGTVQVSGSTLESDFMNAIVEKLDSDGIEIRSTTGAVHTFTPTGISKETRTLALWGEELGSPGDLPYSRPTPPHAEPTERKAP